MKSRMYPLNLLLYLLLLYLHTYCIHVLLYLLLYVRTYCTYYCTYCTYYSTYFTHTHYTYCCAVRTTYCYTYNLHCWCTYVYILKKKVRLQSRQVPTAPAFCKHVLHLLMYYGMYLLLMHVRMSKKKKLPAAVSTYYCWTYVPTALVLGYLLMYVRTYCTYCCSYWWTYVPTVRTALTNGINKHLLHNIFDCTYSWWCMLLSTYCCTYFLYQLQVPTDDVRT